MQVRRLTCRSMYPEAQVLTIALPDAYVEHGNVIRAAAGVGN